MVTEFSRRRFLSSALALAATGVAVQELWGLNTAGAAIFPQAAPGSPPSVLPVGGRSFVKGEVRHVTADRLIASTLDGLNNRAVQVALTPDTTFTKQGPGGVWSDLASGDVVSCGLYAGAGGAPIAAFVHCNAMAAWGRIRSLSDDAISIDVPVEYMDIYGPTYYYHLNLTPLRVHAKLVRAG